MGSLYIRLLRLDIEEVRMNIIRAELTGRPLSEKNRVEITNYQLADGQVVKGDVLPIRLFLKHIPLAPTFSNVADLFGVNYYLSFDFIDKQKIKYTSTCEIQLYRDSTTEFDVIKPEDDVRMVPPINIVNLEQLTDVNMLYCECDNTNEEYTFEKKEETTFTFTEQQENVQEEEKEVKEEKKEEVAEEIVDEVVEKKEEIEEKQNEVVIQEEEQVEKKKSSSSSSSSSHSEEKNKGTAENTIDDFIF